MWAFIFQLFYLMYKKLWKQSVAVFLIFTILNLVQISILSFYIAVSIQICICLYIGFEYSDWYTQKLIKTGYEYLGYSSGNNEKEAKLKFLDDAICRRRTIADKYNKTFSVCRKIKTPVERENTKHSFHQYVIQVKDRDRLMAFLKTRNIGTAIHYPVPIPCQEAYKRVPLVVPFCDTVRTNDCILSLPMYPELTEQEVSEICQAVIEFYK